MSSSQASAASAPKGSPTNGIIIGDYTMYETIGKGSFGKVRRGMHNVTGERVAIKILNRMKLKSANMDKKIRREIKILKMFRHPNICRLYEVLQTPTDIFLIMEHVEGGELYDYIVRQGQLREGDARYVFQQVVCALEYCHHFRVVHRDLKPENILLGPHLQVKLIDFGLSNLMVDGEFLATSCGSPNYAAPEVISGKLYAGPEVDVWSCGVVLYALLCGCLPFDEDTIPQLFAKIRRGAYEVPSHVSAGPRNLLAQLLVVDPLHRTTIPQIRDNAWFNQNLPPHLAYNKELYREEDRLCNQVVSLVSEKLNMVPAVVSNQVRAKSGRGYVAYSILIDKIKRDYITEPKNASPGGGIGGTTRTTACQRELNLGLLLSITPAMELLLDNGDAAENRDAYNNATFVPASNRSHLNSSTRETPPTVGSLSSGFSLTKHSAKGSGSNDVGLSSCRSSTYTRHSHSGLSGSPQPQQGGQQQQGPQVGSVAKTTMVYSHTEREATLASNAGWRVGIMTEKRSAVVLSALYGVLLSLGMEWKAIAPFRIAARFKNQNNRKTSQPPPEAQQQQQQTTQQQKPTSLFSSKNTKNTTSTTAVTTSNNSNTNPNNNNDNNSATNSPVFIIYVFRLHEKHDNGFIIDFSVRSGGPLLESLDVVLNMIERLLERLG